MFSYYGSKSRLVAKYPPPSEDTIIEPFAGSARYALRYAERDIRLNDLSPTICDVWRYLIQARAADIRRLPELEQGEDLRNYQQLSRAERRLLGFAVCRGAESPRNVVTRWAASEIRRLKERILENLPRIRHWKVTCKDYLELANERATWFVDPPYVQGGERYPVCRVDYSQLSKWCKDRNGQVIVCENEQAAWLPFRPLCHFRGQSHSRLELIYERTAF